MIKYLTILSCSLFLLGCGDSPTSQGSSNTVKYEVYGTEGITRANITYKDTDGEWAHDDNTTLPWTLTISREDDAYVYVSGEMIGTGTITAKIYKNNDLLVSDSSSDPDRRAIASGYL